METSAQEMWFCEQAGYSFLPVFRKAGALLEINSFIKDSQH